MTTAEKITIRARVANMRRWLQAQGVSVLSELMIPEPVITVSGPVKTLVDQAIEINERVNGLNRVVFAARVSGVCVAWRE